MGSISYNYYYTNFTTTLYNTDFLKYTPLNNTPFPLNINHPPTHLGKDKK